MPLYDCMLLMKPKVSKESMIELVSRIARRVYQRNGVLTDVKSFGTVQLGYGIKKKGDRERETDPDSDGDGKIVRYYQGQLMQMTMMVPPSFNKELHYLQKEDRLLRWLVVKHRGVIYGLEYLNDDETWNELQMFRPKDRPYAENGDDDDEYEDEDDSDEDEDEDDNDEDEHKDKDKDEDVPS